MSKHIYLTNINVVRHIKSRLQEITEQQSEKLQLLGQPFGANLEHCIYLGLKYCPEFATKAKYYIQRKQLPKQDYRNEIKSIAHELPQDVVFIDFYGDKNESKR